MLKRTLLLSAFVSIVSLVGAPSAFAQNPNPRNPTGINKRQANQAKRIKQATQNGELTKAELDKLRADEAALRAREKVFRDSGQGLDSAEYKALEKELNRVSKEITRLSHNGRRRGGGN